MNSVPEWQQRARAMRDEGMTYREIGEAVGYDKEYVRLILNAESLERVRENRKSIRLKARAEAAEKAAKDNRKRQVRADTLSIARRYVSGELDRHEMMRILRGEVSHAA